MNDTQVKDGLLGHAMPAPITKPGKDAPAQPPQNPLLEDPPKEDKPEKPEKKPL